MKCNLAGVLGFKSIYSNLCIRVLELKEHKSNLKFQASTRHKLTRSTNTVQSKIQHTDEECWKVHVSMPSSDKELKRKKEKKVIEMVSN